MHFKPNTETITYFLNDSVLQVVLTVKDLGVLVDNKLKFADHCFECVANVILYAILYQSV